MLRAKFGWAYPGNLFKPAYNLNAGSLFKTVHKSRLLGYVRSGDNGAKHWMSHWQEGFFKLTLAGKYLHYILLLDAPGQRTKRPKRLGLKGRHENIPKHYYIKICETMVIKTRLLYQPAYAFMCSEDHSNSRWHSDNQSPRIKWTIWMFVCRCLTLVVRLCDRLFRVPLQFHIE